MPVVTKHRNCELRTANPRVQRPNTAAQPPGHPVRSPLHSSASPSALLTDAPHLTMCMRHTAFANWCRVVACVAGVQSRLGRSSYGIITFTHQFFVGANLDWLRYSPRGFLTLFFPPLFPLLARGSILPSLSFSLIYLLIYYC